MYVTQLHLQPLPAGDSLAEDQLWNQGLFQYFVLKQHRLESLFSVPLLQLMEEYDWGEFAVITSLLPGYDTFVDIVESYTDTSYFLWNLQDIMTLEMSVGASDVKTKRLLQQVRHQSGLSVLFPCAKSLGESLEM